MENGDDRLVADFAPAAHFEDRADDIAFDVALEAAVERAFGVVLVVEQHVADRPQRVGVVRHFVLERHAPFLGGGDAGDGHLPQFFAHGVQQHEHHVVHERVPVHEKIGVLGLQPAAAELLLELPHRFDHPRVALLQQAFALLDVAAEPGERPCAVLLEVEVAYAHRLLEIHEREDVFRGQLRREGVPEEQRVDRARVLVHEAHEVEDVRVVLGGLHADVVQRRGVAEVVLGGIGVGVEQPRGVVHQPRLVVEVFEQVVEVAVHAQDRIPVALVDHRQQDFFAFCQVVAQRDADFELQPLGFVVVEDAAPERHVVVPFDEHADQPIRAVRVTGNHRNRFGRFLESYCLPFFPAFFHIRVRFG